MGRGVPGVAGAGASGMECWGTLLGASDGIGCRGPVRICPGFGAGGAGLDGIGIPRGAKGIVGTGGAGA
jgi:hypothetical protein